MEALICDIRGWYAKNMLKLNDDKTEMLIIGSKYRQIPQIPDLHVGSSVIAPASHVINLGVIIDSNFTVEKRKWLFYVWSFCVYMFLCKALENSMVRRYISQ